MFADRNPGIAGTVHWVASKPGMGMHPSAAAVCSTTLSGRMTALVTESLSVMLITGF
jgi:hypothetical protein